MGFWFVKLREATGLGKLFAYGGVRGRLEK